VNLTAGEASHPPDVPTYEYRCPKGHDFEHFVPRISEAKSAMQCPECGEPAERRISAGGGLLFKGSGFYITDYGKDGKKDQRSKPAASKTVDTTKSDSASSKPADAATAAPAAAKSSETSAKSSDASKSSDSK
jgi:putative FmdB family regulatory protein